MRKYIIEIALPSILRILPKKEDSEDQRTINLKKLMNFIEKEDVKVLNCNILLFRQKKTKKLVMSINNNISNVNMKVLFPTAEKGRSYFLREESEKKYAPALDSKDTTYVASTKLIFEDLPEELQTCVISRYAQLDEENPCTKATLAEFISDANKKEYPTEGIFLCWQKLHVALQRMISNY